MTNLAEQMDAHDDALNEYLRQAGITDASGLQLLKLVRMAGHAYDAILSERMRASQLSGPRWRLLLRLLLEEQQGVTAVNPTHLSRSQAVSKNTISAHLRALEEQGLIERELDRNDRRQFLICLSDEGRQLIQRSTPEHMIFLNELAASLSPTERATLAELLAKLLASLHDQGCCNWPR